MTGSLHARQARLTLAALVSVALLWVIWPYLGAIFWSVVLAIVFAPLYRWFLRVSGKRRVLAGVGTLLALVLGLGVPLVLLAAALLRQARGLYADIAARRIDFGGYVERIWNALPAWIQQALDANGLADMVSIREKLSSLAVQTSQFLATNLLGIGLDVFSFLVSFAIMLFLLYVLLEEGESMAARIERFSPLEPAETAILSSTFVTVIRATVKGGIVMAATQGVLGGLALAALGIQAPLFWGLVFGVLSMIPAVGAGLLWAPIALYFLVTGAVWKGIVLVVFGSVVLTVVDNTLRPYLVGRYTRLPAYLIVVATLGGIATLGINGLIIGPVVAAIFMAVWNMLGAVSAARQK
jgi:predicted PurR-regulated permease PerM